ncbi:MAG: DUF4271 domain-containing protein [Flavitalea sp.]
MFLLSESGAQTRGDSTQQQSDTVRRPAARPAPRPVQPDTIKRQPAVDTISKPPVQTPEQIADSLKKIEDSLKVIRDSLTRQDSLTRIRNNNEIRTKIAGVQTTLKLKGNFNLFGKAVSQTSTERRQRDKDLLFYFLCGLVLYFAILKLAFGKYLNNLFTLFFRVTMRQNQIREQLLQTPLPSLLLNVFFAISAGMYLNLLSFHLKMNPSGDFWINFSWCLGAVSLLYIGKLLILKTMGWIFNVRNATNTYLFIVFLVNKMIGMFLLPFLFILSFPHPGIISGMITLSFILLIALFFYRFIISYRPIRSEINVGRLHFIIYLCAFEIAPLLLIYKVLLIFVERSN